MKPPPASPEIRAPTGCHSETQTLGTLTDWMADGARALQVITDGIPARLAITQPETKAVTPTPRRVARDAKPKVGSVKAYMWDRVFPAYGDQTEIRALMQDYRA
jgi:hypothetical protein